MILLVVNPLNLNLIQSNLLFITLLRKNYMLIKNQIQKIKLKVEINLFLTF